MTVLKTSLPTGGCGGGGSGYVESVVTYVSSTEYR